MLTEKSAVCKIEIKDLPTMDMLWVLWQVFGTSDFLFKSIQNVHLHFMYTNYTNHYYNTIIIFIIFIKLSFE